MPRAQPYRPSTHSALGTVFYCTPHLVARDEGPSLTATPWSFRYNILTYDVKFKCHDVRTYTQKYIYIYTYIKRTYTHGILYCNNIYTRNGHYLHRSRGLRPSCEAHARVRRGWAPYATTTIIYYYNISNNAYHCSFALPLKRHHNTQSSRPCILCARECHASARSSRPRGQSSSFFLRFFSLFFL